MGERQVLCVHDNILVAGDAQRSGYDRWFRLELKCRDCGIQFHFRRISAPAGCEHILLEIVPGPFCETTYREEGSPVEQEVS